MAKDPAAPKKKLQEGERVLAYLRRKRLENVLTLAFALGVGALLAGAYLQWTWETRMAIFSAVLLVGVPIGVWLNTHYWVTDRRVLRSIGGVLTAWPVGAATPRVVKDPLSHTLRFEDDAGALVVEVKAVDNAPRVLNAWNQASKPPEPAPPAEGGAEPAPA